MPTRNINLTDHNDQFVDEQVASGRYQNASEVLRAGLRLLERQAREEEQRLAALRRLATEGFDELDQGLGVVLADDEALADYIASIGRRVSERGEGPSTHG